MREVGCPLCPLLEAVPMNRNTLLLLAVFAVGCAAGMHVDSRAQAQNFPAPAKAQKWQQECVTYSGSNGLNRLLKDRGQQGWEFTTAVPFSAFDGGMHACFKRPTE